VPGRGETASQAPTPTIVMEVTISGQLDGYGEFGPRSTAEAENIGHDGRRQSGSSFQTTREFPS
jgi:hypothetical protein